jgi:DNA-binding SARP family transcriptional activator/WD40 repeat protein
VEAARLCNAAQPGEILCSDLVRVTAGTRGGHRFGPVSERELKGLAAPLPSCALLWSDDVVAGSEAGALRFAVLGPLSVQTDGHDLAIGGPKERAVLAALLAADGAPVSIDALIDAVWGDSPPRSAPRTIHSYIARLRSTLGASDEGPLTTHGRSYALATDRHVDALQFADLSESGRALLASGDPGAAVATFDDALALWRGTPYEGHEEIERCANAATALEELRQVVIEDRFDARLALGQSSEVVPSLEAAVAAQPLRERLWGQLMLALYRSGRQADALRAYQRARRVLAEELGIEPGTPLRDLESAILDQDDTTLRGGSGRDRPIVALPASLDVAGSALIGRDDELGRLRGLWAQARAGSGSLVSLVGPEGIGKTRLIAQLAGDAHEHHAIVGYSRCDPSHRSARALFDQVLRSVGSSLMRAQAGALPGETLGTSIGRCVRAWAEATPVLLVLDDLHDAEGDVLEVVAELAATATTTALLVVAIFRTEPGDTAIRPIGDHQFVLGAVGRDAVAQICALYGNDWTTDDLDRVSRATGCVPLAVHEEATSWIRDAAARRVDEAAGQAQLAEFRLSTSQQAVADEVVGIQRVVEERRRQLATRTPEATASVCPYKGLMRFEVEDAQWFFGRERLVAELAAHLVTRPVVAVVGASGSGKSSLVRAGLVPALAEGALPGSNRWWVVVVTPGATPEAELDQALASVPDDAGRVVVVVDQFEELFTLCADPLMREAFARALAEVVENGGAVIVAARADQIANVAEVPTLTQLLRGNEVLVGPIRERELRDIVTRPAQRAGLRLEDGLVDELLADAHGGSGVLPLVQTALLETWIRRTGNVLTLGAYHASGGVQGAVARLAEGTYAALTPAQQDAARRILVRLADASEDGTLDLRRRVHIDDVARRDDTDARVAFEQMVEHRLLTTTAETVEVTHEALLREWPRLRAWLADDVEGRRLHQRLGESARAWAAADRDLSELLRGARLSATHEWAMAHDTELNDVERQFLEASRALAGHEIDEANARADREARTSRSLRRLLIGVAVLLVVALFAGGIAVWQRGEADNSANTARRSELAADANRLSAQALVDPQLERALLSALAAVRLDANVDTRAGLIAAMQRAPNAVRLRRFRDARISRLALSLDGRYLATTEHASTEGDNDGKGFVLDARTLADVATFEWEAGPPVAFLANGMLAHVERPEAGLGIVTSRPETPEEVVGRYTFEGDTIDGIVSDSTGKYLAAAATAEDQTPYYLVWAVDAPGKPLLQARFDGGSIVVISPDGSTLAMSQRGAISLVDVPSGTVRGSVPGDGVSGAFLAFSPDGRWLTAREAGDEAGAAGRTVVVYDAASQVVKVRFQVDAPVRTVVFGADSASVIVGTERGAEVWDLDGTRRTRLRGQAARVTAVAADPDGEHAYSASLDGTLVRWGQMGADTAMLRKDVDSAGDEEFLSAVDTAQIGPDGNVYYLTYPNGSVDGQLGIRDHETGKIGERLETGHDLINTIDWSPDGATFATGGGDAQLKLWDRADHKLLATWREPNLRSVLTVDFSADGSTLAVALGGDVDTLTGRGRDITLLDAMTLQVKREMDVDEPGATDLNGVSFAPSGSRVAFGHCCVGVRMLLGMADAETGRELWRYEPPIEPISFAWSPDGTRLALGDRRGSVMIVDAETGKTLAGPIPAHAGLVFSVAFAPDGETLFTGGTDGQVRLWRSRDVRPIGVLDPADGELQGQTIDVRLTDDGKRLLIALGDSVWEVPIDVDALAEHLCGVVSTDLSREDWESLLPGRPYQDVCPDRP